MKAPIPKGGYPLVRVANFTDFLLPEHEEVHFSPKNVDLIVTGIRKYTDLPLVFVLNNDQSGFLVEFLGKLKQMRSPCYPYALYISGNESRLENIPGIEIFHFETDDLTGLTESIRLYSETKFIFDKTKLSYINTKPLPLEVDILVVGAGIIGLYAGEKLREKNLSYIICEKTRQVGGIWTTYANITSKVNSSEGAYRLIEPEYRSNRDHSSTAEILSDIKSLADEAGENLFTDSCIEKIDKGNNGYKITVSRNGERVIINSKGIILAINDRVGAPREITWKDQDKFEGTVINGISDQSLNIDWNGKKVVIVGMGAFAVENARTALNGGARHVTVVCRRHGTICPKIIDYLNFATPYNERFEHDNKSNIRNMMLWKKLYAESGATEPECWMGKIKHTGHTISVSDIWFIAHHLKKLDTVIGSVDSMYENGVISGEYSIDADIVVNCVGFHRNTSAAESISGRSEMYNNNYIDKDFMYLADAYIDDNAFNSFLGSSVLEMAKFYLEVYFYFFDNSSYEQMIQTDGINTIPIGERAWSHYIAGAETLVNHYPQLYDAVKLQIDHRSANFHQVHDLEAFIAENKREWVDTHHLLAGKELSEDEYLPFGFEKLIKRKL